MITQPDTLTPSTELSMPRLQNVCIRTFLELEIGLTVSEDMSEIFKKLQNYLLKRQTYT